MARFLALSIFVIIPAVFSAPTEDETSVKTGRAVFPGTTASAAGGAVGGQFAQQEGSQETHNDKNIAFNYDKKQGSSSNFKNTGAQAGAGFGAAQVSSPYGYPSPYPAYPSYGYPSYPGVGYPGVGHPGLGGGVPGLGAGYPGQGGGVPGLGVGFLGAGVPGAGYAGR